MREYTIIKETEKARLAEFTMKNGQKAQVWCPKRNACFKFEEALDLAMDEKERDCCYEVTDHFTVEKETEKAVCVRVPLDFYNWEVTKVISVWMPKSVKSFSFLQKKVQEIVDKYWHRTDYLIQERA